MTIPFLSKFLGKNISTSASDYESAVRQPSRPQPATKAKDSAESLSESTHEKLVALSRYALRNFGIVKEACQSKALYSIGDGLKPQPRSTDPEWNARAAAVFLRDFKRIDITGRNTGLDFLYFASYALDTDGEIFFVKHSKPSEYYEKCSYPALQVLESHRLSYKTEGNIVDGIEFDDQGREIAYHFNGLTEPVKSEFVFAVREPSRATEVRCAPAIQHMLPHLLDARQTLEMQKENVKLAQKFVTSLVSPNPDTVEEDIGIFGDKPKENKISEINTARGGQILKLPEGTRLEAIQSNQPNSEFPQYIESLYRDALLGGLPYEIAVDASKIGGAAVRLQTWRTDKIISRRQQVLIDRFLDPLWKFIIAMAINRGELSAPKNWTEVEWATPRSITVDNGREAAQMREDVRAGLYPIEDFYSAMNFGNFEEEMRRRIELTAKVRELAESKGLNPADIAPVLFPQGGKGTGTGDKI